MIGALQGMRVLVTRPARQAAALCQRLQQAGASARLLPLFEIAPPLDPEAAIQKLRAAATANLWIFTSANAVRGAARLCPHGWPDTLFAIGAGTERALAALGCTALTPEVSSSEALLLWPELDNVGGLEVLVATGEGGRTLLAETLAERGALVSVARTYRRQPLPLAAQAVTEALDGCDVALITSGESLLLLLAATPLAQRPMLLALPLVVPAARVVELARQAGFCGPLLVPDTVSDAAYVERLQRWRHQDAEPQPDR